VIPLPLVTKYYYFNGQRVAMRQNGQLTYLHGDHLGSTVLTTDSSGNGTVQTVHRLVWNGNWVDAAWDAGGLIVDVAATALPVVPGGAATALKLGRAAVPSSGCII